LRSTVINSLKICCKHFLSFIRRLKELYVENVLQFWGSEGTSALQIVLRRSRQSSGGNRESQMLDLAE